MTHQHAALESTVYFWFAANDTAGSGDDGASAVADVRLAGATISDAPILSPTPGLLSHANYPAGCYEVAVAATTANGFASGSTYAVFCSLAVDSQNPSGFVGSVTLTALATAAALATVDGVADAIQAKTDNLPADPADASDIATAFAALNDLSAAEIRTALGMASADLDTQLDAIAAYVDTEIAAIIAAIGTPAADLAADIAAVKTVADAVQTVTDQLVAAQSEPTGVPAANATPLVKLGVLFMALRNRVDVTAAKKTFYDDGGSAAFEKDLSDDGTTYSESEVNAI